MTPRRPILTLGLSLVILTGLPVASAGAADCGHKINCNVASGGAEVGITRGELANYQQGLEAKTGAADRRTFEYTSVYACPTNVPGANPADVPCAGSIQGCAGNTPEQGLGPLVRLYRRELDASGNPIGGWTGIGTTCFPDLVSGKPVLGLGRILAAFHNTPWAKPTAHIQPEGNVTLVTLATYFEVNWPTAGFQPGEIDTVTLLGTSVRIRPTVQAYTYDFGDGTSFGPTPSAGGAYPDGDITHAYPKAGTYDTHIDITYGGEFSIAGGAWLPIPDSVTVAGSLQPLTVKTANARLVTY
ncbi:MAG: hypothetical protein HHJ11_16005 [Phycicoccus sp.]|nr:hypothetical protein [Phycicoccus sp.]NMM33236.1 hypothetical protein [Phycicoccus sp.]